MARIKWNIDKVRKFVKENSDCELLSTEYVNCCSDLEFKCACGEDFKTSIDRFKNMGKRHCAYCGYKGVVKHTDVIYNKEKLKMEDEWRELIYGGMKYQISNIGRVRGISGKLLNQRFNTDGYPEVTMGKEEYRTAKRIHQLVAMAFIYNPDPENLTDVNHIDFDRTNNIVENLEWCTHKENINHSYINGRYDGLQVGEKNGNAKLTEDDVREIRRIYDNGELNIKQIADKYGRGWQTINHIVKRSTWKNVI